jgi:hypothetical protein
MRRRDARDRRRHLPEPDPRPVQNAPRWSRMLDVSSPNSVPV